MKRLKTHLQRGFTMIELLVVIAIIGVLAAAVLAAINPVEQINKGRDTSTRALLAEVMNGSERFFAVKEVWPWNESGTSPSYVPSGGYDWTASDKRTAAALVWFTNGNGQFNWISALQDSQEIKENYYDRVDPQEEYIYAYKAAGSDTLYMCFEPQSKQFQEEAEARCTQGVNPAADATLGFDPCAAGDEFICLP